MEKKNRDDRNNVQTKYYVCPRKVSFVNIFDVVTLEKYIKTYFYTWFL